MLTSLGDPTSRYERPSAYAKPGGTHSVGEAITDPDDDMG
jgi:hypothetical protein